MFYNSYFIIFSCFEYSTVGNAVLLFGNLQALLLIIGKAFVHGTNTVHYMEWSGVLISFVGAILCSADSEHN